MPSAPSADREAPLLAMREIVKEFPGVRALDGVSLEVREAEVHCLLGQNGAGKSTLIKVLAGVHQPDEGVLLWRGEQVRPGNPTAAIRLGISTVYQELDLVEGLSVAENVFLGHERARFGFTRRGEINRATAALLHRLGHGSIAPTTPVGRLPASGRQIVSMARALSHDARLIVMDEPSAALAHNEVESLFRTVRELTAAGVAVVYISHRLDEIREIGDRVTVLKDGRTAAAGLPARGTPTQEIVALMTGRRIEHAFPRRPSDEPADNLADNLADDDAAAKTAPAAAPEILRVEHLTLRGRVHDVSFSVQAGEIVGLAGLVGSGRSEILSAVFGAVRPTSGRVLLDGAPVRPGSTHTAVRRGMGLAPEERKSQGLLMLDSVGRNITIASLSRYARLGWFDRRRETEDARRQAEALDIRPADPHRPIRTLSGGNQQKAVLARWLLHGCRLLLLDEPTRGVDIGARSELYAQMRKLADSGIAILLVSSEIPEVLGLSDRVLVIRDGRVIARAPARELDEHRVLDLVMEGSSL
ncbi:sugar ABC transporter ATP-binding protein [Yinghuangia soli]|uniref:Sugar ABC transporter ATP-binding protein n=1 Tax=Yinghuangia soli TaxID=2908204 RepID=A0AA41Q3V6_9ACTN|nr:sugar ABC transporter ATP-binding protein [Yinghuangia soli]MCF2531055.1 sugar ABC transporter ATP-binding protein [Yinghuangia soli]